MATPASSRQLRADRRINNGVALPQVPPAKPAANGAKKPAAQALHEQQQLALEQRRADELRIQAAVDAALATQHAQHLAELAAAAAAQAARDTEQAARETAITNSAAAAIAANDTANREQMAALIAAQATSAATRGRTDPPTRNVPTTTTSTLPTSPASSDTNNNNNMFTATSGSSLPPPPTGPFTPTGGSPLGVHHFGTPVHAALSHSVVRPMSITTPSPAGALASTLLWSNCTPVTRCNEVAKAAFDKLVDNFPVYKKEFFKDCHTFKGLRKDNRLHTLIRDVEESLLTETERVQVVFKVMTGEVLEKLRNTGIRCWSQVKQVLMAEVYGHASIIETEAEFRNLSCKVTDKPSEFLDTYRHYLSRTVGALSNASDDQLLTDFKSRFPPSAALSTDFTQATNLDATTAAANTIWPLVSLGLLRAQKETNVFMTNYRKNKNNSKNNNNNNGNYNNNNNKNNNNYSKDPKRDVCRYCDKPGHWARECRKRKYDLANQKSMPAPATKSKPDPQHRRGSGDKRSLRFRSDTKPGDNRNYFTDADGEDMPQALTSTNGRLQYALLDSCSTANIISKSLLRKGDPLFKMPNIGSITTIAGKTLTIGHTTAKVSILRNDSIKPVKHTVKFIVVETEPGHDVMLLGTPFLSSVYGTIKFYPDYPPVFRYNERQDRLKIPSWTRIDADLPVARQMPFGSDKRFGKEIAGCASYLVYPADDMSVPPTILDGTGQRLAFQEDSLKTPVKPLLDEFAKRNLFTQPTSLPPHRPGADHEIRLISGNPPVYRHRPAPFGHQAEIRRQLELLQINNFVRPSKSPYGAPVLLSKKKDGAWRFCIDYRMLNQDTVKDRFPLPNANVLIEKVGRAKVLSKVDCWSGFHQIRIVPGDESKTAFRVDDGIYEWNVLPFGLCNSPPTFQRLMNKILKTHIGAEEHRIHLRAIFETLLTNNISLNAKKCTFANEEVEFLGHMVGRGVIRPMIEKLEILRAWPVPTTKKDLQSFLGLANYYRRFVKDMTSIMLPLLDLTTLDSKFVWTNAHTTSFNAYYYGAAFRRFIVVFGNFLFLGRLFFCDAFHHVLSLLDTALVSVGIGGRTDGVEQLQLWAALLRRRLRKASVSVLSCSLSHLAAECLSPGLEEDLVGILLGGCLSLHHLFIRVFKSILPGCRESTKNRTGDLWIQGHSETHF
eukprot:gene15397-18261_t